MKFLTGILFCVCLHAQIACKTSLESSVTLKGLVGGRVTFFKAITECKNYSTSNVGPVGGVDIDLALTSSNTIPSVDANAMLTKTFNNQPGQRITQGAQIGLGTLGVLEASKAISLGAGPFGIVVAGVVTGLQYVIPYFTANEIPLNLGSPCDQISGMTLASGQSFSCNLYIQKPPKGQPNLPSVINFTLSLAEPLNSPAYQQVIPPVMLKAPTAGAVLAIPSQPNLSSRVKPTSKLAKIFKKHTKELKFNDFTQSLPAQQISSTVC